MTEKELMLTSVRNCRRLDLYVDQRPLTNEELGRYRQMKAQRAAGRPLQYVIGHCDFMGLQLKTDERVLIPRPETEIMVDLVLEQLKGVAQNKNLKILDLGTGSGNIAIALSKNLVHCHVTTVDVSPEVVVLARVNATDHGVDDRIEFVCKDMRSYCAEETVQSQKFDLIISNPPYIRRSQLPQLPRDVQQEPRLALDGGEDGLEFHRLIIEQSPSLLNPGGLLFLEIGDEQEQDIKKIFAQRARFKNIFFHKDYVNTQRIVSARLKSI